MCNLIGTVDGAVAKIVIDKSIPQGNAATGIEFVCLTKEPPFAEKNWRQSLVKGSPPQLVLWNHTVQWSQKGERISWLISTTPRLGMKQSVPGHWKSAVKGTSCLLKSLFSAIVGLRPSGNGNRPKVWKRSTGYKLFSLEAFKEQATKLPQADGQPGPGSKVPPCGPSAGGGSTCGQAWHAIPCNTCTREHQPWPVISVMLWCPWFFEKKTSQTQNCKAFINELCLGFMDLQPTSLASCKLLMSIVFMGMDSWCQFDAPSMPRKPNVNVTTTTNVHGIHSRAGLPAAVSVKSIWTPKSPSVSESLGSKMRFRIFHSLFVCGHLGGPKESTNKRNMIVKQYCSIDIESFEMESPSSSAILPHAAIFSSALKWQSLQLSENVAWFCGCSLGLLFFQNWYSNSCAISVPHVCCFLDAFRGVNHLQTQWKGMYGRLSVFNMWQPWQQLWHRNNTKTVSPIVRSIKSIKGARKDTSTGEFCDVVVCTHKRIFDICAFESFESLALSSLVDPKRQLSPEIHRLWRECPTQTKMKRSQNEHLRNRVTWTLQKQLSSLFQLRMGLQLQGISALCIVYVLIATSWVCRRRKVHEESSIWKFWNRLAEIVCFLSIQTWGARINIECLESIEKLQVTNFRASKLPKACPSIPCPIPWRSYQCRAFLARTVATWCNCLSTQKIYLWSIMESTSTQNKQWNIKICKIKKNKKSQEMWVMGLLLATA